MMAPKTKKTKIIRTIPAPVPAEHVVLTPDVDSFVQTPVTIGGAFWLLPVDAVQMHQVHEQVLAADPDHGRIGFQVTDMLQGIQITEAVQKTLPGRFVDRIEMRHSGDIVVECPARVVELV